MGRALVVAASALVHGCVAQGVRTPLPSPVPNAVWSMPARPTCESSWSEPEILAALDGAALDEAALHETSGIVPSPSHEGVLWLHADSGDRARLYAISTSGGFLGTYALNGVEAVDWEDIAAAPCPDLSGPCLYVADTGNNNLDRTTLVVYAVPEPEVSPQTPLPNNASTRDVWRFPFTFEGEPANIEAFFVTPDASAMVFYEKSRSAARVFTYRAPWTPGDTATIETTTRFDPPGDESSGRLVTAADIHPSGARVLLRTYDSVFEARVPGDDKHPEALGRDDFVELFPSPAWETQGEAVAYDEHGTGVWLVSETSAAEGAPPLDHANCQ